jgi:hypothetical protein
MDDYDYDDRCDGEQREANIWNESEDACERLGIPFDPVAEGLIEEEEEDEAEVPSESGLTKALTAFFNDPKHPLNQKEGEA